ncbi:MAG: hypothetical protein JWN12_71 [Candidatus Saccharibacteria bacterium]|nr:hypothetical protein [Candidatus Saccharibacteria bacterium]
MKEYFQKAKTYVVDHKKEFILGGSIIAAIAIILLILALYSYNTRQPSIVYEPANACALLTMDEAKTLLGDKTINGVSQTPVQQGNLTVSKCSYSDGLPDTANAVVAAIVVRSGINDAGILQNKNEFVAGKPSAGIQDVTGVGDSAYFNAGLGQLNVLKDSTWILVSYGSGASPQSNSLDDTVKLAKLVLNAQ